MMAKRKLETEDHEADWTSDDKLKLLEEMKQQCPAKDNKSFTARVGKLDWGKVQVEGRTPQQCQEAWAAMVAKVRKFRTLEEMMGDARIMILHPDKRDKKQRHPDEPIKPLTAYFQYVQDHRQKLKTKNPDLSNVELMRLLSQKWQALDPKKQNKYMKRYKKQWEEFQEAKAKFLEEHPELNDKQRKPKQPSPVSVFMAAKLPALMSKHADISKVAANKKLRKKYTKLSAEKKKKWIDRALAAVPDYEEEVRHYQAAHPDFQPPTKKVRLTKEEAMLNGDISKVTKAPKKNRFPGAPVKPPRSGFMVFVKKKIGEKEGTMTDKMKALSLQWRALGTKQKKYDKKLAKLRQTYQEQLEEFKQSLTAEELEEFEQSLKPKKKKADKPDKSPSILTVKLD